MDKVAIYMRLSKSEKDSDVSDESNSIRTQRQLLYQFVREQFLDCELLEFVDDGYSGTGMERPGMTGLLNLVRESVISCIVVKDFSRFSRDYIELGAYLDEIFPFMGVRFISVNDRYDSAKDGMGKIDVAFRTLLYDLYSKDLSVKVSSALHIKREKGIYTAGNCPFGYGKAPDDRHRLVILEEEAQIVRRIFSMAEAGMSSVGIAKYLNEEGVRTPAEFLIRRGHKRTPPKGGIYCWSAPVVCRILQNAAYAGDMVYGKYEKNAVGGKNHIKPRSEWRILRDHHEPIVPREQFEHVGRALCRRTAVQETGKKRHPLTGIAVCGCCGRNLVFHKGTKPYFRCPGLSTVQREGCVKRADAGTLSSFVLTEIRTWIFQCIDSETLWQERERMLEESLGGILEEARELRLKKKRLALMRLSDYEAYVQEKNGGKGEQPKDMAAGNLWQAKEEEQQAGQRLEEIRTQEEAIHKMLRQKRTMPELLDFWGLRELSGEIVKKYIEAVIVTDGVYNAVRWGKGKDVFSVDKIREFHYNGLRSLADYEGLQK